MATLEPEEAERRKKTRWLMAGGAASLILPLAGAIYLRWSENAGAKAPSGRNDVFEHRDNGDKRLTPSQSVVPNAPMSPPPSAPLPNGAQLERPGSSSLDFIKSSAELTARVSDPPKPAQAPAPPPLPMMPPVPDVVPQAPPKAAAKNAKKSFTMPKLQTTKGFTNFKGQTSAPSGGAPGVVPGAIPGGVPNPQQLMNNLPGGNNPQIQQYMNTQGK